MACGSWVARSHERMRADAQRLKRLLAPRLARIGPGKSRSVDEWAGHLYFESSVRRGLLSPRISSQEVPAIPLEIQKHGQSAIWLIARRRDEPHTCGNHTLISPIEIIDAQEHTDATRKLLAHNACLLFAVRTREQNACLASIWTNHNPTLRAAIIGQRRRVFHQLELQDVNEEADSRIVVPDHQSDEFKMRHSGSGYSGVVSLPILHLKGEQMRVMSGARPPTPHLSTLLRMP